MSEQEQGVSMSSPRNNQVTVVGGGVELGGGYVSRSRSNSPRSNKVTTSLCSGPSENVYKDVHIYDNVASVIGDSLKHKASVANKPGNSINQNLAKNKVTKRQKFEF